MRTRMLVSLTATLLIFGAGGARLEAQASSTVCKDGTTSTATGKGACSGHGGVDAKATAAAQKAAKTQAKAAARTAKAEPKAVKTKAKTEAKTEAKAEAKTRAPSLPAAVPATSPARAKSEAKSKAPTARQQASNRADDNDPTGAIAQCKDGLYSHATNRRGACSKHGGVAKWLKS